MALSFFPIPFLITVLAWILLVSGRDARECRHGWEQFSNDSCVKRFMIGKTYADARAFCRTQSATLVRIGSQAKTEIEKAALSDPYPYWIATKDGFDFRQVKGYFDQGEWPMQLDFNLTGSEKACVKITSDEVGSLKREDCNKKLYFFCETYVGNQGVCPKPWWHYHRENTCIIKIMTKKAWWPSYLECFSLGGIPMNLWNTEKHQIVRDFMPNRTESAWIGMWKPRHTRVFAFSGGERIKVIPPKVWELGDVVNGVGDCMVIGKFDRGLQRRDCEYSYKTMCVKPIVGNSCPDNWEKLDDVNSCLLDHPVVKRTWELAKRYCLNYYDAKVPMVESQRWYLYLKSKRSDQSIEYWVFNNDMDKDGLWEWRYKPLPLPKVWDFEQMKRGKGSNPCMLIGHNQRGLQFEFCDENHFFICSVPSDKPEDCRPPYYGYRGVNLCFREYKETAMTQRAEYLCDTKIRGKLVEIKDQQMLSFVMAKVRTTFHNKYWVINRSVNTNLKWIQTVWENFFPPSPNMPFRAQGHRDNCFQIDAAGELKRVGCTSRLHFICEKNMDANDQCPVDWTPYIEEKICIKRILSQPVPYQDARNYCKKNYRDLVSMEDSKKIAAVKKAGPITKDRCWVGYVKDVSWGLAYFNPHKPLWNLPMILTGFGFNGHGCVLMTWEFNTYQGTRCTTEHYYVCEQYIPSANPDLCYYGWSYYFREKVCIKVFDDMKMDVNDAIWDCQFQGGELVKIWNSEKFYLIREISSDKVKKGKLPLLINMFHENPDGHHHFNLTDGTKINPVDPDKVEWADTELMAVFNVSIESDPACAVLGYGNVGIIRSFCASVPNYVICEVPATLRTHRCDALWHLYRPDNMCINVFNIKKYWFESFNFCKTFNGRLVEIYSKEKLEFVQGLRGPRSDQVHWVGMFDMDEDFTLQYESGKKWMRPSVNAPPWTHPFEVTDTNQCIKTDESRTGFTAGNCESRYYFICEQN